MNHLKTGIKFLKQQKLGTKLLTGGILIVAVPIIVIGIVSIYQITESSFRDKKEDMSVISESLAGALDIGMYEQLVTIKTISYSNSVIAAAEKVAREGVAQSQQEMFMAEKELIKIKKAEGDRLSSINLVDKKGIFYVSSDIKTMKGINVAARDYFKTALNGTPNVGQVNVSSATGRVVCTAASPIYSSTGKDITGVAMMSLELRYFSEIFDKMKIGKAGYAYIVDKNGLYVTHPVKDKILKENISQIKGMETVWELIKQGKSGVVEYMFEGVRKVAAVSPVQITGWSVVSAVPIEELYASAAYTRNMIIIIGIIFLVSASVFFYFFARSLTLPLFDVVEAAKKIAGGDMSVELGSIVRQDEIGTLARAFTSMIKSLKEKSEEVKAYSGQLESMVEKRTAELTHTLQKVKDAVSVLSSSSSEILSATTQVASGTAETATAISETTTTVEEVRQAAQLSSEKAKIVSEKAQRVVQVSKNGRKAVEETVVVVMGQIRGQMESIAQTIVRLSDQTQSIGGIIASVTDIADQSNLLAVNAGIEAAKAGEFGKGFAVVAQEIKILAEQSKQATAQVRGILSDIQKATSSAVMATEQGSRVVEVGVKQAAMADEAIRVLAETSDETAQSATQIVASSQQQVVGMDQIGIAMKNINQAGAETAASMKQAETAAQNLHELGQKLKEIVEQFKG